MNEKTNTGKTWTSKQINKDANKAINRYIMIYKTRSTSRNSRSSTLIFGKHFLAISTQVPFPLFHLRGFDLRSPQKTHHEVPMRFQGEKRSKFTRRIMTFFRILDNYHTLYIYNMCICIYIYNMCHCIFIICVIVYIFSWYFMINDTNKIPTRATKIETRQSAYLGIFFFKKRKRCPDANIQSAWAKARSLKGQLKPYPWRIHGTNGKIFTVPTWMVDFYGKLVGKYTARR